MKDGVVRIIPRQSGRSIMVNPTHDLYVEVIKMLKKYKYVNLEVEVAPYYDTVTYRFVYENKCFMYEINVKEYINVQNQDSFIEGMVQYLDGSIRSEFGFEELETTNIKVKDIYYLFDCYVEVDIDGHKCDRNDPAVMNASVMHVCVGDYKVKLYCK